MPTCIGRPCPGVGLLAPVRLSARLPEWCGLPHRIHMGPVDRTPARLVDSLDRDLTTYVYVMADETEELLYVGMTDDPARRYDQHQSSSPWGERIKFWDLYAVMGRDPETARLSAGYWESLAINTLLPPFNRTGSIMLPARRHEVIAQMGRTKGRTPDALVQD